MFVSWERQLHSLCFASSVLDWSRSNRVVCLARSVRRQQTTWITQSLLWVTAQRTTQHTGSWRTLGAQAGVLMGRYSLSQCLCFTLTTCYMLWAYCTSFHTLPWIPSDTSWLNEEKTCVDWLYALPILWLYSEDQHGLMTLRKISARGHRQDESDVCVFMFLKICNVEVWVCLHWIRDQYSWRI